jgi:hypothetical protein
MKWKKFAIDRSQPGSTFPALGRCALFRRTLPLLQYIGEGQRALTEEGRWLLFVISGCSLDRCRSLSTQSRGRERGVSFFSPPGFGYARIDDRLFWDQDLSMVFDTDSPISSTSIDEVKLLSIMVIHVIFVIFILPRSNI